jgi:hypothetical protein
MEPSLASEANNCSAGQEIPRLLLNPKVHEGVHKSPPPVPVVSRVSSIPTVLLYFPMILEQKATWNQVNCS